jgi:FAD/FMN-containing dehydrogenase
MAAAPFLAARPSRGAHEPPRARARPGTSAWPSAARWETLNKAIDGRLLQPVSPFSACGTAPAGASCQEALKNLRNPYYLGDQVALTQTSGWLDAWTSQPSTYAVVAQNTDDVVAAVNFARRQNLRLVVKGGGHSYQGTSCAGDSLLIWTRHMNHIAMYDAFIARGCEKKQRPQPAVSVGAGAVWSDAYDAVTTRGSRYVQGGGCMTVGVAGLVQSGGFGSFSKRYGTAAAGLLEAEIVTADGAARIANACTHADLFWAIKGGGGGSFGVITRLTLRTRELPEYFGAVLSKIRASTAAAFRALVAQAISFYRRELFNPHWGEQMRFHSDNALSIQMLFQGLNREQANTLWAPFFDWVRGSSAYSFAEDVRILQVPAGKFWDASYFEQHVPGAMIADRRPGSPPHHTFWAGDQGQVGQFLHGYKSAWMPAALLETDRQAALVDAIFASTRHCEVSFHFNKGLAGAPADEIAAARDTAMNPAVLDAFALVIIAGEGASMFAGLPGVTQDAESLRSARAAAAGISRAMDELLRVVPRAGSYVSESDYFEREWQTAFWGNHYSALARIKRRYDPSGLFFVHHGVGSEAWSDAGFTPLLR